MFPVKLKNVLDHQGVGFVYRRNKAIFIHILNTRNFTNLTYCLEFDAYGLKEMKKVGDKLIFDFHLSSKVLDLNKIKYFEEA